MAKKGISKEHRKFIQLVADGVSQKDAYKSTTGDNKSTDATYISRGSKLAIKYEEEIAEQVKLNKSIVDAANKEKVSKFAHITIISKADRMKFLTDIIESEKDTIYTTDKIRSVAELNKMDGSYAPEKVENTVIKMSKKERDEKIKALKDKMK